MAVEAGLGGWFGRRRYKERGSAVGCHSGELFGDRRTAFSLSERSIYPTYS